MTTDKNPYLFHVGRVDEAFAAKRKPEFQGD